MKKIIAVLLVLTMFFCVTGCDQELSYSQSSSDQNNAVSDKNNATVENIKIDSLDKLNYYAVKKAMEEDGLELLNTSSKAPEATILENNTHTEVLNLASTTTSKIDTNSTFTITMYSYFTITLSGSKGFLAQKLGGTGTVEVVITKNNFNNMITFKKGDNYYSCFETSSTSATMSFSSSKYAMGYYLIENNDASNCEFTVYFEGDRVIDLNCAVFQKSGSSAFITDKIKFNNNFSFVLYKKQSFTAKQLEMLFSSNNQAVDNNSNLNGANIIYEEASLTDKSVDFKNSSGISIITNKHIKKVIAMENEKFGFCIKLELKSDVNISGKTSVNIYIKDIRYNSFFIQKDSDAVYIIDLKNTTRMYDAFYKLTTMNDDNKIGRIITHNDFMKQMSKKLDFNEYDVKIEDYSGGFDFETDCFTYTYDLINADKNIEYKPSNYDITIDDITFTIPIKVSDLIDKGFVLTDNTFNEQLLAGGAYIRSPKGKTFDSYIMNFYGNSTNLYDSYVTQIYISWYEKSNNYQEGKRPTCPDFMLLEGIHKDSTLDDIIYSLGEPNTIIVHVTNNVTLNYKSTLIQLLYDVKTSSIPNGRVVFNIRPVLDRSTPTDFLTDISFSLQ